MSWFQTANITSLAKTALKEAQKTIDKALDIKEEDGQTRINNASTESGDRNVGVSAAVTDMASEFFSSWGVGGGLISASTSKKSSGSVDSSSGSGSNSSSNNGSPRKSRAIFTPPKRSKMDDLLPVIEDCHSHSGRKSASSDVPVTLLAGSSHAETDISLENSNSTDFIRVDESISKPKNKHHTRSLSDTVFHASDDPNLQGLVEVLDDSTVVLDPDPLAISFSSPRSKPKKPLVSPKSTPEASYDKSEPWRLSPTPTSNNASTPFLFPQVGESEYISTSVSIIHPEPSNLELLQEIDLDGGGQISNYQNVIDEKEHPRDNVICSPNLKASVESSALSDGWDWAESIDSRLTENSESICEERKENAEKEEVELKSDEKTCSDSACDLLGISEETLKLDLEVDAPKTEIEETSVEVITPLPSANDKLVLDSAHFPAPASSSPIPKPEEQEEHIPIHPSRPPSPTTEQGQDADVGESTPPSSARVSPNFEMVSSGVSCVVSNSGGALPESSRSSSIVVVSGRESTPNSRGTSGAGSSGSSEGGHDIIDGEIPHSPAGNHSLSTGEEFPRKITKHKKGASSSSSSDIEVIPSDYSCSSATNHPLVKEYNQKITVSDREIQTEPLVQYVDCEMQTEEVLVQEPGKGKVPDLNDISQYVSNEVADILAEKEQEVQQLREEGEKLSLKQFELSQAIKKLRAKEKETDGTIKGLRTEVATKNLELEKLMKTFINKEGIEQSQNETISKLNQERRNLELKVEELTSQLEDARDNEESMKATVENASIEILELKNVISSVQRESAEVDRLTKDKAELISRTDSLQKEVDHLRSALNSSQSLHHTREAELKGQISTLRQKVHSLETRLADISSEVADATMPLSMEIEKLQAELKQQVSQSDRREQVMQSTITDLEMKLRTAVEKEKSAKDLQIQFQSQHSTLELRIEELEAKNRNLSEQLHQKEEIFSKKLEDKVSRCQKLEKTVERLTGEVERLCNENDTLSMELKTERTSLDFERRRNNQNLALDNSPCGREGAPLQQQQQPSRTFHHPHHQRSSSMSTTASSTGGVPLGTHSRGGSSTIRNDNSPRSRGNSPSEHSIASEDASYLDEVFDPNTGMMIGSNNGNRSMTPKSFFESFSSAGLIENLQSQLRIREGEVIAFQEELSKNEKIRKQLNEEIANLTMQNQQLGLEMEKLAEMEQKLEELNKNYNAVLQMYGEKVEEADELRMDLEDVKEMYKAQIEQLLKKS